MGFFTLLARTMEPTNIHQFYNAVLFLGSVAVFSLIAQRMNAHS